MKRIVLYYLLFTGFSIGLVFCGKRQGHDVIYPEPPMFNITGSVFASMDSLAIQNMEISIITADEVIGKTFSDADGNFAIDSIYSENYLEIDYLMDFTKEGFEKKQFNIEIIKENLDLGELYFEKTFILTGEYSAPGSDISGIAWDGNNIWTCDETEGKIYKHDDEMNVIQEHIIDFIEAPRAMLYTGTVWWIGNRNNFMVYKLDNSFNRIDSVFIQYVLGNYKYPTLELTINNGLLVSCENVLDRFGVYNPDTKNLQEIQLQEFLDPFGIVWAGGNYYVKYGKGINKLNESFEVVGYLRTPASGINQLTWDGTNFYGASNDGYECKIYKFTNLW